MAITDELRKWIGTISWLDDSVSSAHKNVLAIADRIDEAHKHAIGYVDDRDPETMAENGWYRRPVDADGKPWLRGDKLVDRGGKVETVWMADDDTILTETHVFLYPASEFRHAQPTVEDVLKTFLGECENSLALGYVSVPEEIFAEYAAKLRLAGDGE